MGKAVEETIIQLLKIEQFFFFSKPLGVGFFPFFFLKILSHPPPPPPPQTPPRFPKPRRPFPRNIPAPRPFQLQFLAPELYQPGRNPCPDMAFQRPTASFCRSNRPRNRILFPAAFLSPVFSLFSFHSTRLPPPAWAGKNVLLFSAHRLLGFGFSGTLPPK